MLEGNIPYKQCHKESCHKYIQRRYWSRRLALSRDNRTFGHMMMGKWVRSLMDKTRRLATHRHLIGVRFHLDVEIEFWDDRHEATSQGTTEDSFRLGLKPKLSTRTNNLHLKLSILTFVEGTGERSNSSEPVQDGSLPYCQSWSCVRAHQREGIQKQAHQPHGVHWSGDF